MDMWMDVDTALSEVPVNLMPLVDDTDFKTIEDAVAYNASGMALFWHFVTTGGAYTVTAVTPTTGGTYDWTDQGTAGIYTIEIPASGGASINNDTEGFGWFTGKATGVLPWRGPVIGFRAAALNNLLIDDAYSTTRGLAGTALPNAAADAAGGLPISDAGGLDLDARLDAAISSRGTSTLTQTQVTGGAYALNSASFAFNTAHDFTTTQKTSIGTAVAASAVASVTGNVGGNVAGSVGSVTGAVGSVTATVSADVVSISGSSTAANNAEIVLDTDFATNYNTTVYKWNVNLVDIAGSAVSVMSAQLGVRVVEMANDTITAGIIADGAIDAATFAANAITATSIASDAFTAAKFASDVTTEFQSGLATASALSTVAGYLDTEIAAILADTNELQTDWVNGGRLDLILDARASQTSVDTIDDLLDTEIAALTTELAKVPKSDSTVTWNATALASIQAEANDAIIANNLDHLVLSAVDTDFATTVHLNSVIGHLADAGTSATFDRTTDALEVLGAATAPSAASIADAVWTEAVADHSGVSGSTAEALAAAGGAGDPWITALPGSYSAGQAGYILGTNLNATVSSRATQTSVDTIDDLLDSEIGALTTELAKVPKSDGSVTWNATALASINTQCDTALSDYDAPTNTEMVAAFTQIKGATWATTDTLEAIRDRGDAAWTTATGFSTHSASDVWAVATRALTDKSGFTISGTITTLDALDTAQDTQHGTTQTAIADVPTVAEFEARTLAAANYFDPAADTVANVTLVGTLTTYTGNTPQTGDAYAAVTSAVPDSVPADGSRPSIQQAVRMILQALIEGGITGTTWTVNKEDGSTALFTVTLDDDTTPTGKTRAT